MKILYHHRTQGSGAEGVHIREIVKALRKLGHEVFVVSPPGVDVLAETEQQGCKGPARVLSFISKHVPQLCFETMELLYNITAAKNIKKVIREQKIDFIYERYAFFCWAGVKVAKSQGIPIIMEVNEISGIKRVRGQVLKGLAKRIERSNFESALSIIVVSQFLKEHITALVSKPEKILVIPNGVNLDHFSPGIPNLELKEKYKINSKIVLGFVGGFVGWHNFDFLFESFQELLRKRPDLRLMLVGDGSLKEDLLRKAKVLGIEKEVIFTGTFKHKEIPGIIQLMDICIIPHSNEYRSPIKLFEYMAMAKPVVAPRVEPIESVVKDGEEVLLFTTGDHGSLQEKIEILLEDRILREKIGKAARKVIEEKFIWENNALKIIKTVEGIINRK